MRYPGIWGGFWAWGGPRGVPGVQIGAARVGNRVLELKMGFGGPGIRKVLTSIDLKFVNRVIYRVLDPPHK